MPVIFLPIFLYLCSTFIHVADSVSTRHRGCPLLVHVRTAVDRCIITRMPCCYTSPMFDWDGCFLGCTTNCFTDLNPKLCNVCRSPEIRTCFMGNSTCQAVAHYHVEPNATFGCFQRCKLEC
ncbi:uncharacterized protein LOC125666466 [Ostrea edulis]|uniref:uncharacterized protein LOC125666466 n=1 Tax=Ostrea edulis TaxID=37623 RepID=UPI0024AFB0BE|nr:uncharacterized protein LOC125666466 [Ostrea edulis]